MRERECNIQRGTAERGTHPPNTSKCRTVPTHLNEPKGDDCSCCFECYGLGGGLKGSGGSQRGLEAWEGREQGGEQL